ncbi:tachylectin-related carbohydrate-binding protein [Umezawaea sp. Da 62-37]|uniref:tachylectin-related carbohydrate-binding protein n=1 Tax=Umezawaea sp. Da 62-37 TaxID=3075927 RepID=UPI0028F6C5FD|nr:tachylectin-related carbohydrate-binding protein [Umezawaea sp. Da 62-37]WNV88829.1 tachylectin-related carbohydrate-binding protein [Umezawaea sp. Da 62-37]
MRARQLALLATAGLVATTLGAVTAPAALAVGATCAPSARIMAVKADGTLWKYDHTGVAEGVDSWGAAAQIGSAWGGRTLAGPDGVVYNITDTGELRRFRYTDAGGWATFPSGLSYEVLGTDWEAYVDEAWRDRITVDSLGHLYAVDVDNHLRVWVDQPGPWLPNSTGRLVDARKTGPLLFGEITAAGPGVILERDFFTGELRRYRYEYASQRMVVEPVVSGSGWASFSTAFSPGGDIVYGIRADNGELDWFRYDQDTNTTPSPTARIVGVGWSGNKDVMAVPNACNRADNAVTPRPAVTRVLNTPGSLAETSTGLLVQYRVNNTGQLVKFTEKANGTGFTQKVVANTVVNGVPQGVLNPDLPEEVFAGAQNSEVLRGDTTALTTSLGGFFPTEPAAVRRSGGRTALYAVGADGALWVAKRVKEEGDFGAWRKVGGTNLVGPAAAAVGDNDSEWVVVRSSTGSVVRYRQDEDGVPGEFADLGVNGAAGTPALAISNGKQWTATRDANGAVQVQFGTAGWVTVPGVAAAGSPTITRYGDRVELAVRDAAGRVYTTGNLVADVPAFRPWTEVLEDSDDNGSHVKATLDPVLFTRADGSVALVFRNVHPGTNVEELYNADAGEPTPDYERAFGA